MGMFRGRRPPTVVVASVVAAALLAAAVVVAVLTGGQSRSLATITDVTVTVPESPGAPAAVTISARLYVPEHTPAPAILLATVSAAPRTASPARPPNSRRTVSSSSPTAHGDSARAPEPSP